MTEKLHSSERLARALEEVGLTELARRAREHRYHDFLSPLAAPTLALMQDLADVGTRRALEMRDRVKRGEFDSDDAEADAWAESDEGRPTLGSLGKGRRR